MQPAAAANFGYARRAPRWNRRGAPRAGHYTKFLTIPAVLGVALFIHQEVNGSPDVPEFTVCGLCVALWATWYIENWKRTEAFMALRYGMSEFEKEETTRPEFNASPDVEVIPSPVTGAPIRWFPPAAYKTRLYTAMLLTLFMVRCSGRRCRMAPLRQIVSPLRLSSRNSARVVALRLDNHLHASPRGAPKCVCVCR
jgi:hypothetical protein